GLGIAYMLLGMALFTVNDALGKWLVADYPVGQLLAMRSLSALLLLVPFVLRAGPAEFRVARPRMHLIRVALVAAEVALFYVAVRDLPLADVMTIYMAAPLFVTALSVPLLGERVGWRRWVAVLAGFSGVVLVLGPTGTLVPLPSLVALAGSVVFALGILATRSLRGAGGLALVVFQTVGTGLAGAATLPFAWVPPDAADCALIALLGVVAMAAHVSIIRSLALSPAATVVPFQYSSIVWAVILGMAVWGDVPSPEVVLGATLIIGCGLFVFHRERRGGSGAKGPEVTALTDGISQRSKTWKVPK
ncbi:MAG TPA: DMT family transporter, partial [Arenibaculum sp.]|nr:DMT family transporter [Arenibaculum sp.]